MPTSPRITLHVALRRLALRLLLVVCAPARRRQTPSSDGSWSATVRAHPEDISHRGRPRRWLGQRHERCRDRVGARTGEFRKRRAESGDDHVRRVPLSRKSRDGEGRRERDVRRRERDVRLRDPHRLHLRLRVYLAVERRFASSSAHGRGARDDGRARTTSREAAHLLALLLSWRESSRVRASTRPRTAWNLRAPRRRLRARVHAAGNDGGAVGGAVGVPCSGDSSEARFPLRRIICSTA